MLFSNYFLSLKFLLFYSSIISRLFQLLIRSSMLHACISSIEKNHQTLPLCFFGRVYILVQDINLHICHFVIVYLIDPYWHTRIYTTRLTIQEKRRKYSLQILSGCFLLFFLLLPQNPWYAFHYANFYQRISYIGQLHLKLLTRS